MLTEAPGGEVCCAWCPGQHPWPGPRPLSPTAHRTMFPPPRSTHPEKASARPAGTRRQEVSPGHPPPPSPHGFRLGAPQTHGFLAELAKKGKGRLTQLLRVVRCGRGFHKVIVWREKKNKTKQKWNCHHSVPIDEASARRSLRKAGFLSQGSEFLNPGPHRVRDARSPGEKKWPKKLRELFGRDRASPAAGRCAPTFHGCDPRLLGPGARRGLILILGPQPAGLISASAGPRADAPVPRGPKVSRALREAGGRAVWAATAGAPGAHPARRPARIPAARC